MSDSTIAAISSGLKLVCFGSKAAAEADNEEDAHRADEAANSDFWRNTERVVGVATPSIKSLLLAHNGTVFVLEPV